jgi:KDO2-lipid IV(A) lauroyltransferase
MVAPELQQIHIKRKLNMGDLEEFLYRLVLVPLVAFLPGRLAYGIARLRGEWRYRLDASKRTQLMHNLGMVFGDDYSDAERANLVRDFFRRKSCEAIDVMRLAGRGRALERLVEIRGLEHVEAALATGKGAIICSTHFGSFNSAFSLIGACGFPVTVVGGLRSTWVRMSPIQRALWRLVHETRLERHRRGPNIEPAKVGVGTAILMAEILRSNELIAIAIDAPLSPEESARSIPVNFLGRQILLLPGSVNVAQLTGSSVLIMIMHRLSDWQHQVLEISPVPLQGDDASDIKSCMQLLEASIRQNPAYWDWWVNAQDLVALGLLPGQEVLEKVSDRKI